MVKAGLFQTSLYFWVAVGAGLHGNPGPCAYRTYPGLKSSGGATGFTYWADGCVERKAAIDF